MVFNTIFSYIMAVSVISGRNRNTRRWFSTGVPVSSTNNTDRHYITENGVKHHKPNPLKK
jgi:hypothetical protein